nr:MAG TPA: hypothetical protein [Caudoviricetes sp.]
MKRTRSTRYGGQEPVASPLFAGNSGEWQAHHVSFFNVKDFVCAMKVLYLCRRFNYIFRLKNKRV